MQSSKPAEVRLDAELGTVSSLALSLCGSPADQCRALGLAVGDGLAHLWGVWEGTSSRADGD
jgi:hypothetical protein